MNLALTASPGALLLYAAVAPFAAGPNERVIPAGETVVYDTTNGPILLDTLEIQAGAILRVQGPFAFRLHARESIRIDGTLDLSGFDHPGVFTLNTPNQPELGAPGGPAGGRGGTASSLTTTATPAGLDGGDGVGGIAGGGGGGESGFNVNTSSNGVFRRAAGAGGGVFGPPELVAPNVEDPANLGRVALAGVDGNAQATGAVSGVAQPQGGVIGSAVFADGNPNNDFFGTQVLSGGGTILGELAAPQAGQGGGAGGDAVRSAVFPPVTFVFTDHDKGGAGGGGGGLGILISRKIIVGSGGSIVSLGGDGGGGENTSFVNRIGGGGGGGSGGMLALQAEQIDLSQAAGMPLSALGGAGGPGANDVLRAEGGGGHGSPGLIQLHVPGGDAANVLLPAGSSLSDLSAPTAHVLQIEASL